MDKTNNPRHLTSCLSMLHNILTSYNSLLQDKQGQCAEEEVKDLKLQVKLAVLDALGQMSNIERLQEISNLKDELRTKVEYIQEQSQIIDQLKNELRLFKQGQATARERILEQKLFDIEELVRPINEGLPSDKLCREIMLIINRCG